MKEEEDARIEGVNLSMRGAILVSPRPSGKGGNLTLRQVKGGGKFEKARHLFPVGVPLDVSEKISLNLGR